MRCASCARVAWRVTRDATLCAHHVTTRLDNRTDSLLPHCQPALLDTTRRTTHTVHTARRDQPTSTHRAWQGLVPITPSEAHMSKRPTNAELTAALAAAQAQLAQFATPAAVAEATAPPKPETASDKLKAHVEANGHAFARGGRTVWTVKTLKAVTEVLKTGEPQLIPVTGKHAGRGVTHVAVGLGDEPGTAITQNVYTPGASA